MSLLSKQTLKYQKLNTGCNSTEEKTCEHTKSSAFHTADHTEKANEADRAKHCLLDLYCHAAREGGYYHTNEGDQLIANGDGGVGTYICCSCDLGILIISVHNITSLSKIVYGGDFLKME